MSLTPSPAHFPRVIVLYTHVIPTGAWPGLKTNDYIQQDVCSLRRLNVCSIQPLIIIVHNVFIDWRINTIGSYARMHIIHVYKANPSGRFVLLHHAMPCHAIHGLTLFTADSRRPIHYQSCKRPVCTVLILTIVTGKRDRWIIFFYVSIRYSTYSIS